MSIKPQAPFGSRLADVQSSLSQAVAILELVANYGEDEPVKTTASYGALTIIEIAINTLGALEIEVRHRDRTEPLGAAAE